MVFKPRMVAAGALAALLAASWSAPPPAYADPPPWAPAHGYRAKGKGKARAYDHPPSVPFDIDLGRCNREALGQVLGGVAGAAVGSTVRGDDRPVAIVAGAIIGVLIGGAIGRHMDEVDHHCVGQALEYAETGRSVTWRNPDRRADYRLTPSEPRRMANGEYCREYRTVITVEGRRQEAHGTACRQPDGSWRSARR